MAQGGGAATRKKMMMPLQQDAIDPDQPYPMTLPRLGHAVIVNNIASEMPGSLRDVEALKVAYETVGFDVRVHNDCGAQEMRRVKKWIMNEDNHLDSNCFALTVISHGNDKGHLFDKNRKRAWDTELFLGELSDVETLVGKPKIIVIQACRGLQFSEGKASQAYTLADEDDRETTHILPDKADMFLTYATVPGYRANAGTEDGSIYLQALAKYLQQEYMNRPLDKILKMVRQLMIQKVQGTSSMKQCPEERNSLIYDVMFSAFHQKGVSPTQKQQKEIEEQRRKLDEEREKYKRKEAAMATKLRQSEEERRAIEAKMSGRIKKLKSKMKEMKTAQTPVEGASTNTEQFKNRDDSCKKTTKEAWKLLSLGSFDEALVKAERALEIEEKELGARDQRMAELYQLLVAIWVQKASTGGEEGKEYLDILHKLMNIAEKAITIYRQLPQNKANKRSLGELLKNYVYALTEWSGCGGDERLSSENARDKAKSTVEEMITIAKQIKDTVLLVDAYTTKGNLHVGDEAAVQWYNEALRIAKEYFGRRNEHCGVIYYNAGNHHEQRGELQEAYENFKQSYLLNKEIKGDKHPFTEGVLESLREDRYVQIAKQRGEKW